MTMTTCCFCFNLRGGTIIIATLSVIVSLHSAMGIMKAGENEFPVDIDVQNSNFFGCERSGKIDFELFIPAVFTEDLRKFFIFFYFFCSAMLLLSTLQNGSTGFLPWIGLTSICMVLNIENAIGGLLKLFAYCDIAHGLSTLVQLTMIYGIEIYLIRSVYYCYKQMCGEIENQVNGRVFSCEESAQAHHANIPGVVTCPMPNDLPPPYDQVVSSAPRYPVF